MTDEELRAIEARADAATPDVCDDGYRIRAPDGALIAEYKHAEHDNAQSDGVLFSHARGDVLRLIAEVRRLRAEAMRHVIGLGIVALAVSAESHEPEAIIKAINDAVERARTAPPLP